jgi:hypothetical protein
MNRGTMRLRIPNSRNQQPELRVRMRKANPYGQTRMAKPLWKESPMIGVVEWTAPVRNTSWVAACFGTVDR